jgi:hypothetical protein
MKIISKGIKNNKFCSFTNVKFAKFIPIASVNEEMMKQAKDIVNKTISNEPEKIEEELQNV